jgi:hypothetical protein
METNLGAGAALTFATAPVTAGTFVERMRITSEGLVGIGCTPATTLDIVGTNGNLRLANVITDNTQKFVNITSRHNLEAEEDVCLLFSANTSTAADLCIGGGSSTSLNAVKTIKFYTAADTTTVTGTERMHITSGGLVGVGTTPAEAKLEIEVGPAGTGDTSVAAVEVKSALNYHGRTGVYPTHVMGAFDLTGHGSARGGGFKITGFSDDNGGAAAAALTLWGVHGTSGSTGALAAISLMGGRGDGSTGVAKIADGEVVAEVLNLTTQMMKVTGEGTVRAASFGDLITGSPSYIKTGFVTLADDASVNIATLLPGALAGMVLIKCNIGGNTGWVLGMFGGASWATIAASADFANADTDTKLCFYFSGAWYIKNRLGSSRNISVYLFGADA